LKATIRPEQRKKGPTNQNRERVVLNSLLPSIDNNVMAEPLANRRMAKQK